MTAGAAGDSILLNARVNSPGALVAAFTCAACGTGET
jgi:hypothetical protein